MAIIFPLLIKFIPINSQTRKNETGIVINVKDHLRHTSPHIKPISRRSYSLNLDYSTWRVVIGKFSRQKTFCVTQNHKEPSSSPFLQKLSFFLFLVYLVFSNNQKTKIKWFHNSLSISPFCLPLFILI